MTSLSTSPTSIRIIPILTDNYAYLLTASNGKTAIVDPGEAGPIIDLCETHNIYPDYIFLTHHHGDHVGGVLALKEKYGSHVIGPEAEKQKIGFLDQYLTEETPFPFGDETIQIISTPGHTLGHIVFYFPLSKILCSGDTLFVMGCGRVFEGTMKDMYHSLNKLKQLPDDVKIYCGHEYALSNAKFASHIAPENDAITYRLKEITQMRASNQITIPSTMSKEKETNPFLRAASEHEFSELRRAKDTF